MLSQLEGRVTISRIAAGRWTATIDKPLEHKHCLGAAIGQLVAVTSEDEPGIFCQAFYIFYKCKTLLVCRRPCQIDCQGCRQWQNRANIGPRRHWSASTRQFLVFRWKPGMHDVLHGCWSTVCKQIDCNHRPLHGHWDWIHTPKWVATPLDWSRPGKIEIFCLCMHFGIWPAIVYFI